MRGKKQLSIRAIDIELINKIPPEKYSHYKNLYHNMQINLKAIFNLDSEGYKEKISQTKWGYFIKQRTQNNLHSNNITIDEDIISLTDDNNTELMGQNISFIFKDEWLSQNIVFVAFLDDNNKEYAILESNFYHIYDPPLQDVTLKTFGLISAVARRFGAELFGISITKNTTNLSRIAWRSEKRGREEIKQLKYSQKIQKQMQKRGWTEEEILEALKRKVFRHRVSKGRLHDISILKAENLLLLIMKLKRFSMLVEKIINTKG
ncbi:hypothetical protein CQA53_10240 [Helicobacter didelphidarum]|uniref:Uncharacterized protein n=1 Tax=Helicobacter didelphidarum TaxID=2040648 RepID=A0A3D8I8E8_9HELI|nr:hypothetical protein [Helicobacter didelphidarum]RDU61377.1 hypothetical protein CQA53_10240 [Helicobacter didelphidarum]